MRWGSKRLNDGSDFSHAPYPTIESELDTTDFNASSTNEWANLFDTGAGIVAWGGKDNPLGFSRQ